MELALQIIEIVKIYGYIGAAVSVPFLMFGIDRIDPSSHQAFGFRALLIPGIVVLWPLVLWRWLKLETQRGE